MDGSENGTHELYLMCDDVQRTVADLKKKGVEFTGPVKDHGWGLLTHLRIPGGGEMGLYEPRHPTFVPAAKARARGASKKAAKAPGVGDKVQIRQQDLFQADIKEATVVTLYLLQSLNMKLRPKLLAELKPGTRIVSHAFDMGDEWKPEKTEEIGGTRIFLWTVPKKDKS